MRFITFFFSTVLALLIFFGPGQLFAAQEESSTNTPGKLRILGESGGNIEVSFEPIPGETTYGIVDAIKGQMIDVVIRSSSAPFYLSVYSTLVSGRTYSLRVAAVQWTDMLGYTPVSGLSPATRLTVKPVGTYRSDWAAKEAEVYYEIYRNGIQIDARRAVIRTLNNSNGYFNFVSGEQIMSYKDISHVNFEKGTVNWGRIIDATEQDDFAPSNGTVYLESIKRHLTASAVKNHVFKDVEYPDRQKVVDGGWYLLETTTGERVQFTVKSLKEFAAKTPSFEFSYGFNNSQKKNMFFDQPLHFFITESTYSLEMIDEYQFQVECMYCKKDKSGWSMVKRGGIDPDPIVDPPISYMLNDGFALRERASFQLSSKIEQNIIKNFDRHQFRVKMRTKLSDGALSPWSRYEYFRYTLSN